VDIARNEDHGLERLVFDVVSDTEEAAGRVARALGFVPMVECSAYVKYFGGVPHDLLMMELRIAGRDAPPPDEPAEHMF
jgi:hypothetical protein